MFAVGGRHFLPVGQRQLDVFIYREIANQVETLEDESDLLIADARALGKVEVLDRLAIQRVAAIGRRIEQADDRKQRGLAAARGPDMATYSPLAMERCTPESAWVSISSV